MKSTSIGYFVVAAVLAMPSWGVDGVTVGNQEWLQPIDFMGYTYNQVLGTCPGRECAGMLPSSDVNLDGYTWASSGDVEQLFATYEILGKPILADFKITHSDLGTQILYAFLGDPRQEYRPHPTNPDYVEYGVYTAAVAGDGVDPNEVRDILPLPSNVLFPETGGAWFWRVLEKPPEPPIEDEVDLHGRIRTQGGVDVCALVLASGQFMFSCDPLGFYALEDLPKEPDGTVVRQIYADGFFPKVEVLEGSTWETVTLERATNCPDYNLPSDPTTNPQSSGQRHSVSGRALLQSTDSPVCALILANGSHTFSCDAEGHFSLDFPLDEDGQYTLQAYADGFAPSIQTFNEFDNPQEVRMARASECKSKTIGDRDIVVADGKKWLQPDLFTNLTWNEINDVCSENTGVCTGILNGYNITGWTWASVNDLNALFNHYIGFEAIGPGPDFYSDDFNSEWADAFFDDGWRDHAIVFIGDSVGGWVSDSAAYLACLMDDFSLGMGGGDGVLTDVFCTNFADESTIGAWFYRTP